MIKLQKYTNVNISTSHITLRDSELLTDIVDEVDPGFPLIVNNTPYGWLVYCYILAEEGTDKKKFRKDLVEMGFSNEFVSLLELSAEQGAKWVDIDQDGTEYDDLPSFDWED